MGCRPATCLEAFQSHLDYIFAALRRFGVSAADREDVAQEVFLGLLASWPKFEQHRPVRPYLFGLTFRIAAAYRRKHDRQVPSDLDDVVDESPDAEEVFDRAQRWRMIEVALNEVPLFRRVVLIMRDFDDVPVAEVARALSIPLFTAYSRLRVARRELRAAILRSASPGPGPAPGRSRASPARRAEAHQSLRAISLS